MRQSSKNILYTVANSRAYEEGNMSTGILMWQIVLIVVDILLAAVIILLEVRTIKRYKSRKPETTIAVEEEKQEVE